METKVCTKCKKEKPVNQFSKSKNHKCGYFPQCKECINNYKKEHKEELKVKNAKYYKKNKEKIQQYFKDNAEHRREQRKVYKEKNKERISLVNAEYSLRNADKRSAYSKKWYRENKEKAKETRRRYRVENAEKIKEIARAYAKTEKGKAIFILSSARRRSLSNNLISDFTRKQWKSCKEYFDNCCAYCGMPNKRLTQDHFIPVTKGGAYTKSNIIPACQSCNCSKSNRDFQLWYVSKPFFSQERYNKILNYLKIEE